MNHDGVSDPRGSTARLGSRAPSTLLGQAAIAGASDAVPSGNLVYVCGNSGISVFDVTNVTTPQLLRTVGTAATACQIRGDKLVALRSGNTFVLALYSLTDPQNPQRLGSTPEIPYNFAGTWPSRIPVRSSPRWRSSSFRGHLRPHRRRLVVRYLRSERAATG